MEERGRRVATDLVDAIEAYAVDYATELVNAVARARRVSAHHLALTVPGLCHTHLPDDRAAVRDCAYCRRRGNCFAA